MGEYNSSETRVKPLMEFLDCNHESLSELLSLVGFELDKKSIDIETIAYRNKQKDKKEKPLYQSKDYLIAAIEYVSDGRYRHNLSSRLQKYMKKNNVKTTINKRNKLFDKDENVKKEAIRRLNKTQGTGRAWYILEGASQPDAFIETKTHIFIIEGKRTESGTTKNVTFVEPRDQMVRHIQGALNYATGPDLEKSSIQKKVVAFYIVEDDFPEKQKISKEGFSKTIDEEMPFVKNMKCELEKAFYSYTTWQKVSETFPTIHFPERKNSNSNNI